MDSVHRRHKLLEERRGKLQQRFRDNQRKVLRCKVKRKLTQLTRLYNLQLAQQRAQHRRQYFLDVVKQRARSGPCVAREVPPLLPVLSLALELSTDDSDEDTASLATAVGELHRQGFFAPLAGLSSVSMVLHLHRHRRLVDQLCRALGIKAAKQALYMLVMMADLGESLATHTPPGFNANTGSRSDNLVATFLWLVVYKLGFQFWTTVERLARGRPSGSDWSIGEFRLRQTWCQYHQVFPLFKRLHLLKLRDIISEASAISEAAGAVASHSFDSERLFVYSQAVSRLSRSQQQLLRDIYAVVGQVSGLPVLARTVSGDSYHVRYLQHSFVVPPMVRPEKWRRFWFNHYAVATPQLRSGRLEVDKSLHIEDIVDLPPLVDCLRVAADVRLFAATFKGEILGTVAPSALGCELWAQLRLWVGNAWVNRCKFSDYATWCVYENLAVIVAAPRFWQLRSCWYTNSPHLLFPRFYQSLPLPAQVSLGNTLCFADPCINGRSPVAGMADYFRGHYWLAVCLPTTIERDEVNAVFIDQLRQFQNSVTHEVHHNAVALVRGVGGTTASELVGSTLRQKLVVHRVTRANFPYCDSVAAIVASFDRWIDYVIGVYTPLFNWVYQDIGPDP